MGLRRRKGGSTVTLEPDQIDVEGLPRAVGGGFEREAVEELLTRVQAEYAQLYKEHERLKEELDRRDEARNAAVEPAAATQAPAPEPETPPERAGRVAESPGRELDDLARVVLSSALRAARVTREAARQECETMLKKTRARNAAIEKQMALGSGQLRELAALMSEMRAQMRATLETLGTEPSPIDLVEPAELSSAGESTGLFAVARPEAARNGGEGTGGQPPGGLEAAS
jgi:cell division septum initiation protein DivIVA